MRLRPEVEKVSASTAVVCGLAVRKPSVNKHLHGTKGPAFFCTYICIISYIYRLKYRYLHHILYTKYTNTNTYI